MAFLFRGLFVVLVLFPGARVRPPASRDRDFRARCQKLGNSSWRFVASLLRCERFLLISIASRPSTSVPTGAAPEFLLPRLRRTHAFEVRRFCEMRFALPAIAKMLLLDTRRGLI